MVHLWEDHPGQPLEAPKEEKKKKKKGGGKTVSSVYLVQLAELMGTLHSTEPHFIRCIVPNTHKKPLETETPLIMHQLTCNGVLEGIRVCMLGFPNRIRYADYKMRYMILGASHLANAANDKEGVKSLMTAINFEAEKYRCGHTMVFFRAGALAALEEARDGIVLKLVRWLQGEVYGRVKRREFQKKSDQRELMKVIQRNFRKYMTLRTWGWFVIIQKTKPLIGQINLEDELRMLEEAAVAKFGAYEEQLKTKERLGEENELIKAETVALIKQLEAEQGNLSQYTDQQERAAKAKVDFEQKLVLAGQKLIQMEEERVQATADKKVLEGENLVIKKDMEDIELAIQKLDQEKTNRDHTIRHLNDEIANQDEVINKLNKEKKHMGEVSARATEDLQSTQDKVDHLSNIKSKLESTLDELEDACNKEKRSRADIEKSRRKLEGELKVTQETVGDLERSKKELEGGIGRKEKELAGLASKLEDEQSIVAKVQKTIKEIQGRVEELEEELEAERQARAKAEGKRSQLAREYEELGERLNEAGGATNAQVELNKKREAEIGKLRKDAARDCLHASERRANSMQNALEEARTLLEQADRSRRITEQDLSDTNEQLSDLTCTNQSIAGAKRKLESEMQTLNGELDEMASEAQMSDEKAKKAMVDAARLADELRTEQDVAQCHEKDRKLLECQAKDMQIRLDEAEVNALKGGKKAMSRMETRIRELESELEAESRRFADSQKNLRRTERRIKELTYAADEDRKNHERMQALLDQLQSKIKTYKKQIEEAEEIAAMNLSKFRTAQANLGEAQERADLSEQALAKCKVRGRSASIGPQ